MFIGILKALRNITVEKVFDSVEPRSFQINLLIESFFPPTNFLYPLMPIFHPLGATGLVSLIMLTCLCAHLRGNPAQASSVWSPAVTHAMQAVYCPTSAIPVISSHSFQEGCYHYLPQSAITL